jgi:hypothetical protein
MTAEKFFSSTAMESGSGVSGNGRISHLHRYGKRAATVQSIEIYT